MKKILLIMLASLFTMISFAQSTRYFERVFSSSGTPNTYWVRQLSNGDYITGGSNGGTLINAQLFKVDIYGNMALDSSYIDSVYQDLWEDAHFETDSTLIVVGWHRNPNNSENMSLSKMDTSGHILWSSFVGDSSYSSEGYCVRKTWDGGYILAGGTTSTFIEHGIIVKTDSFGHKQWDTVIGFTPHDCFFDDVIITPDSGFAFTGVYNGDEFTNSSGNLWIVKMDKNGIVTKDTSYSFIGNSVGSSIGLSNDGDFIIGGYINNEEGLLIKLDSSFHIVWDTLVRYQQDSFIFSYIRKIVVLTDGSIVGSGAISAYTNGYAGYIVKFSPTGGEIWRRYYKLSPNGYDDYFYALDTTSDGGFILCGRSENPNGMDAPIVKTNCLGFIAPPTASFTDSLGYNNAVYFTNTSINTDTCYWNWGDSTPLQMVRADSTVPVTHTYLSSGLYTVTLIAIACGEADTFTLAPLVTSLTPSPSALEKGAFIYPNPNDGSFTLNSNIPNSLFQIKDVTGRTVYSTNITKGTQTISLPLDKGIYFWEVVRDSGVSAMGKLAVIRQ